MTIVVVDRPAFAVTGILVDGYWDDLPSIVPAAWRTLFSRVNEIETAVQPRNYVEVSFERDSSLFHEMVAIVTPAGSAVPDGMHQVIIPANRYVHLSHYGPLGDITASFQAIYDHGSRSGISVTDFKLDFGYDPDFSPCRHDLFVGIAVLDPPRILEGKRIVQL